MKIHLPARLENILKPELICREEFTYEIYSFPPPLCLQGFYLLVISQIKKINCPVFPKCMLLSLEKISMYVNQHQV